MNSSIKAQPLLHIITTERWSRSHIRYQRQLLVYMSQHISSDSKYSTQSLQRWSRSHIRYQRQLLVYMSQHISSDSKYSTQSLQRWSRSHICYPTQLLMYMSQHISSDAIWVQLLYVYVHIFALYKLFSIHALQHWPCIDSANLLQDTIQLSNTEFTYSNLLSMEMSSWPPILNVMVFIPWNIVTWTAQDFVNVFIYEQSSDIQFINRFKIAIVSISFMLY